MTDAYRINEWEKTFEKSQSKRAKTHHWVAMPIKHDGGGFRRISIQPNATDLFAAWCLIVQVAAKCPERGVLTDDTGRPFDSEDLAIKTGFKTEIFDAAFEFFSNQKIGWLTRSEVKNTPSKNQDSERAPSEGVPAPSITEKSASEKPHSTVQYKTNNTQQQQDGGGGLLSKNPEYQKIIDCKPLAKITIERYAEIKHAFPKVNADQVVSTACLKAGNPEEKIKSADGFIRTQFQYAPDADPREIPYAFGGKKIRLNSDGSFNAEDHAAFRREVC